ncbi:MAG: redoxin domain-containing protein [Flavobacteriales bacterium]|nr:redoxin domain-containing protein [Flavobacteriales bacterium]
MKTVALTLLTVFCTSFFEIEQINVGDKAPKMEMKMMGIDGKSVSLKDLKKEKGLCVIFSCNTCPWVMAWEDRYNELNELCAKNNIGFVLINSNEAKRAGDDSMAKMKEHAKAEGYESFAYLVDEKNVLADAFGATKTPDVFLFNGNMELVYKGAIDDNSKDKTAVEEPYLKKAIEAVATGKTVNPAETKALGCSIKRAS